MLLTEASSRALALAVSRRRGRALADATRKAETALAAAFRKQGKILLDALPALKGRFAEALREGTAEDFEPLFNRAELATLDVVEKPLKDLMRESLTKGARVGIADLKATIRFDLAHPVAVAYVEDYGADLVRAINETTRSRVRAIVSRAVEEGWSYNATAKELTDLYQGFAVGKPQLHIDSRAHLIAVQEAGQAYEAGTMLVGQELAALGLEVEKSWLAIGDDRTSELCRNNAAAGWISIDASYPSGHERPLGHVVCRCCGLTRMAPDAD